MSLMLLLRFTKPAVANAAEHGVTVLNHEAGIIQEGGIINTGSHRNPNFAHVTDDPLERLSHWSHMLRDIQSSTKQCGLVNSWLLAVEPLKRVMCGPRPRAAKPFRGVRRLSPRTQSIARAAEPLLCLRRLSRRSQWPLLGTHCLIRRSGLLHGAETILGIRLLSRRRKREGESGRERGERDGE